MVKSTILKWKTQLQDKSIENYKKKTQRNNQDYYLVSFYKLQKLVKYITAEKKNNPILYDSFHF